MVKRPNRKLTWIEEGATTDSDDVITLSRIEPLSVGPLVVQAWVKFDNDARRGTFVEVAIDAGGVVLYHEQVTPTLVSTCTIQEGREALARKMIEDGLTIAHATIAVVCDEVEARLRLLRSIRDSMDYVTLNRGPKGARLTRELAQLVLMINNPDAPKPLRLEASPNKRVALAFNARGELVGRIGYDPTDARNFRNAGEGSQGYYGFYELQQPRPAEEVAHEQE